MNMIRQEQIRNAAVAVLCVLLLPGTNAHAQTATPAKESAFSFCRVRRLTLDDVPAIHGDSEGRGD
jgi:hypothetical protein